MSEPIAVSPAGPTPKRSGPNPKGNPTLHLSPRCGARTRCGGACRAPAVHGRLRCRMHGGRSTGPRTAEGLARLRAARTTHGRYSAEARAQHRHTLMTLRRMTLLVRLAHWIAYLPAELAARVPQAPELLVPPSPRRGITPREDRAMRRLEAAAQGPWRRALAAAMATAREVRAAARAEKRARAGGRAHAPVGAAGLSGVVGPRCAEPLAPVGRVSGAGVLCPVEGEALAPVDLVPGGWTQQRPLAEVRARYEALLTLAEAAPAPDAAEPQAPVGACGDARHAGAGGKEVHAPVGGAHPVAAQTTSPQGGAAGLNRHQRRHLKWLQRQAAKGKR